MAPGYESSRSAYRCDAPSRSSDRSRHSPHVNSAVGASLESGNRATRSSRSGTAPSQAPVRARIEASSSRVAASFGAFAPTAHWTRRPRTRGSRRGLLSAVHGRTGAGLLDVRALPGAAVRGLPEYPVCRGGLSLAASGSPGQKGISTATSDESRYKIRDRASLPFHAPSRESPVTSHHRGENRVWQPPKTMDVSAVGYPNE